MPFLNQDKLNLKQIAPTGSLVVERSSTLIISGKDRQIAEDQEVHGSNPAASGYFFRNLNSIFSRRTSQSILNALRSVGREVRKDGIDRNRFTHLYCIVIVEQLKVDNKIKEPLFGVPTL